MNRGSDSSPPAVRIRQHSTSQPSARSVEGMVQLHLHHGDPNACSSYGENNMWNVWALIAFNNKTCIPFPREPLIFEESDGNTFTRQVGLHLNEIPFPYLYQSLTSPSLKRATMIWLVIQSAVPKWIERDSLRPICTK